MLIFKAVVFLVKMAWYMHLPRASERNLRNPSCVKQLGSTYKSNWKLLKSLNVWNDMRDLSVFGYWDQMSSSPVSSLCTNVISGGSYADSGAQPSGREIPESQDHFSACSSCWRNGRGGAVAGAIPGSQDASRMALAAGSWGEHPGVFSMQSKEPATKALLLPAGWGEDT